MTTSNATERAIKAAQAAIQATLPLRVSESKYDDKLPNEVRRSTATELSKYWRLHREILDGVAPQRYLVGQLRNGLANRQQQVNKTPLL